MKCNQSRPGFELVSPCPFPTTITITPRVPSKGVFTLIKTKYPAHIMVSGVVTSDGDVVSPFVFPHGLWFFKEAYTKRLEEVVWSWAERVATFCNRTVYHSSQAEEGSIWLSENFYDQITFYMQPPNSLACNPFDYVCECECECDWTTKLRVTTKMNWRQG